MESEDQGWLDSIWGWFVSTWDWLVESTTWLWGYLGNPYVITSILLLLALAVFMYIMNKKQPARVRAFSNDNGYVDIARSALVDIIRTSSEQVDIEKKPGVVLKTVRGRLHVGVKIRLLPTRRLTEVADVLQKHLIDVLKEGMGIRKLGNINVTVVGVRVKTGKEARDSLPLITSKEATSEPTDAPEPEPSFDSKAYADPEPSDSEPKGSGNLDVAPEDQQTPDSGEDSKKDR
jgi:uncharacterized alkaline shock family protein YloU